ncbi:AAA family ATPase [Roseofilum sp. Guam]|uniref:AAA family ATPase n=1 Tax=Roseofilum sp. Guam TaxID=2821502 RepID=UPI001B28D8BE|nr:AAA family ATPase [Roseofilum sp. Guam]MBP0031480.1 AAA family ATPase [Roseofilum sp. Guam]
MPKPELAIPTFLSEIFWQCWAGLARFGAREGGLLKGLEDLEDLEELEQRAKAAEKSHADIEQSQIFLKYTALLRNLAEQCPSVIILEDLQWVDNSSNTLFFYLVRELKNSRVLFVGLYRPSDVAAGRNGERHPLEQILNEIKRLYGDIWIDLDRTTEEHGQAFVNALIDSEPNKLSPSFRKVLFDRTRGHALFTTELLHAMQERGDLV